MAETRNPKSPPLLLSVVIPAYNEAENFKAGVLNPALGYLRGQSYTWELIFVDDGSTDATPQLLQDLSPFAENRGLKPTNECEEISASEGFRSRRSSREKIPRSSDRGASSNSSDSIKLIKVRHSGKAAAVTAGVLAARGKYVLFTDFDQSTPLYQVNKFLTAHKAGADIVIGLRTQTQKDTFVRKIRSWVFVSLVKLIALPGVLDSQCGFKSFTRTSAKRIFSNLQVCRPQGTITGGYMGAFDVEVLFLAGKYGYKISQVPVTWIKYWSDRLNIWKEPLLMIRDVLTIRLYDILGKYNER